MSEVCFDVPVRYTYVVGALYEENVWIKSCVEQITDVLRKQGFILMDDDKPTPKKDTEHDRYLRAVVETYYGEFVQDLLLEAMKYGMVAYTFCAVSVHHRPEGQKSRVVIPRILPLQGCSSLTYFPEHHAQRSRLHVTHPYAKGEIVTHVFWPPHAGTHTMDSPMARCFRHHLFAWDIFSAHQMASTRAAATPILVNNIAANSTFQAYNTHPVVSSNMGYNTHVESSNAMYDIQRRAEDLAAATNRIGPVAKLPQSRTSGVDPAYKTEASMVILPPATQAVPNISYPVPTTTAEYAQEAAMSVVAIAFNFPISAFMRPKYRESGGQALDDGVHPLIVSTCDTWRLRVNQVLKDAHCRILERVAARNPEHTLPTSIPTIPPRLPTPAIMSHLHAAGMIPPRVVAQYVNDYYGLDVKTEELVAMTQTINSASAPTRE
jgi:hypothetical protein